jgi:hypothetical protein
MGSIFIIFAKFQKTSSPVFVGAVISVKKDLRVTAQTTRQSRAGYSAKCVAAKNFETAGLVSLSPFRFVSCVRKA